MDGNGDPATKNGREQSVNQGSLFRLSDELPQTIGLAGLMPAIRAAMARAAKAYPEGRKSLPDAVSEVAQRENLPLTPKSSKTATIDLINKWLQPADREHEPRLPAIIAFCMAVQDFSPLDPIWKACGLTVIPAAKLRLLAYGEACDAEKKAKKQKSKLEAWL